MPVATVHLTQSRRLTRTLVASAIVAIVLPALAVDVQDISIDPQRPNSLEFAAHEARFVRLLIRATSSHQPCLDEFEVYGPDGRANLALAKSGANATASSCLPGFPIHQIEHLNDGQYGNEHSWIAATVANEWAQVELPRPARVDRVVISRDRTGRYRDRVPVAFDVLTSMDAKEWRTVLKAVAAHVVVPEEKVILPTRPLVLEFPALSAKFVRINIAATDRSAQPCIDELEVYGEDPKANLALASAGAKPSASSSLEGYAIHRVEHLNDGKLGNDHSWIAAEPSAWAQVELPAKATIRRVVLSRDRGGTYKDRVPSEFSVELSLDGKSWRAVKRIKALLDVPVESPLPGEDPADWAARIAMELPASMSAEADGIAAKVNATEDVQPLLALYRLHRERLQMLQRLALEFNPDALRRAVADMAATYPDQCPAPEGFEATLADQEKRKSQILARLADGSPDQLREDLPACREILDFSNRLLLRHPLLSFQRLMVLKRKVPAMQRNDTYWDWGQRYGMVVNWSCDFRPKNPPIAPWWDDEIAALSLPGSALSTIYEPPDGHMVQHPELSFDATRLAFAAPGPNGAFQIFEAGIDGTGLRQITTDTEPDVDNGDPCYLPNGRIVFCSTRGFQGVPCEDGYSYVANLCVTDPDGSNTRMLTFDQESNWYPAVMNDGRVMYTRYEYANISHQFGRLMFRMNPDGTGQMAHYGSNSYWPNSIFYARPIPDHSTRFIGVVCGHHGSNRTGRLVLFDSARGQRETSGAVQTIPGYGKPVQRVVVDALYDGDWPKFVHPWPLDGKYFLASARLTPQQDEYAIYLVDVFDNITEICRVPGHSLLEPIPIQPRPTPPVIPDRVDPTATDATVFLADVYRGTGLAGVPRKRVKKLRVFSYNYMYRDTGHRGFGHLATAGVDGPWEPRYLLGTVPVDADGSAYFRVPANTPISVQPLDEENRALQQMRSWFTAMPGESLSCVGCHEQPGEAPPVTRPRSAVLPVPIEPWRGLPRGFDYELEVQPVLDRYCIGCHNASGHHTPDLSRKTDAEKDRINHEYHAATGSTISTVLTPSFIALHPYVKRPHAESNYSRQVAGEFFADTSPLVQMLKKGHYGVQLGSEAWDRLYTWIDLGAPDHGSWKFSEWGVPGNFHERRLAMLSRFANRSDDVEWLPKPEPAPAFEPPARQSRPPDATECPGWPFDPDAAERKQSSAGLPAAITLELGDGLQMQFSLIPAGEFLMGQSHGPADESPVHRVRIDSPFYMSRHEVTNAQFAALADVDHDSGMVSWRSIDWRGEGYPLTEPQQPVVRVSWHQANHFCRALSQRANRDCSLPTEAQWEWACRAGSGSPMWYGDENADFSGLENLAGREHLGFAFDGKRKWYLHAPHSDDRVMVTARVGSYAANPWGLHDMAGNVCEWTSNAYESYSHHGAAEKSTGAESERVVRGGSWDDPPNRARSAHRWKYPPWLKINNVGIRVVMAL